MGRVWPQGVSDRTEGDNRTRVERRQLHARGANRGGKITLLSGTHILSSPTLKFLYLLVSLSFS